MIDQRELEIAEYEHARNKAVDEWFRNRPLFAQTPDNVKIFEAGFRMAWEYQQPKGKIKMSSTARIR